MMANTDKAMDAAMHAADGIQLSADEREALRELIRYRDDIRAMAEGRRALLWLGYVARYVTAILAAAWAYVEFKK